MSFKPYIQRVNQRLEQCLDFSETRFFADNLTEAMRYGVLSGGKRFRPILTYAVANTFGTDLDLVDSSACAIELIHAYSLIHDDLPAMDDDDMRHNQPACHKRFGEAQAMLAGDALQALAFKLLADDVNVAEETRIHLLQALSHAAFQMAQGQSIDLAVVSTEIDIADLQHMHQKKTGALLCCAVQLGALLSKRCIAEDVEVLESFAQDIGLAYQIQDDVLDILTPDHVLGKKQYSDRDKNKPTYPTLLGLEAAKAAYQQLYQTALTTLQHLSVDAKQLIQLTQQLQSRTF